LSSPRGERTIRVMDTHRPIMTVTLNPAVDLSTSVPSLVSQRKLRCEAPVHEPGGGGINIARVVRTLGGDATAIFPIGGLTGERLRELVEQCGVAHHAVRVAGETRENIAVEARDTGAVYRFVMPGPTLTAEEYSRVETAIQDALRGRGGGSMLVISGSLCGGAPEGLFDSLVAHVRGMGGRVFADVSGERLRHAARAGVSFLKPNRHELEHFAGGPLETEDEVSKAAGALRALGDAEAVLVSLGPSGMLAVTREGQFSVRAPEVEIASTIGAGDSAVAGMVLALAQGRSLEDAVRRGVAAGTATCMTPGTNLCSREDVERIASLME
jgi:6-phosphofructokinase 2